jgi:type III secretion system low calcium response chaperone LcrH/SycD
MTTTDEDIRRRVKESIKKFENKIPPELRGPTEEAIVNMFEKNLTPKEIAGMSPDQFEMLYDMGYKLFKGGKFKQALGIFSTLRSLDVDSFRYNFATGACHQYLQQYDHAILDYFLCTAINPLDPMPHFHMYDCFLRKGDIFPALQSIVSVIVITKNRPEYIELKEKALLEYRSLKKLIKEKELKRVKEKETHEVIKEGKL